jgi:crotonobetaine/carnitine-CoA ligase
VADTVSDVLDRHAAATPDVPLLIFDRQERPTQRLTYAQVRDLSIRTAGYLYAQGLRRGERLALVFGNNLEFFLCWFAAARLGAVMIPLNPASSAEDMRFVFDDAQCRLVVCGFEQLTVVCQAAASSLPVVLLTAPEDLPTTAQFTPSHGSGALDALAVLYTSGTTSRPKGVVISHANYMNAGNAIAEHLRMRPTDRWLVTLPVFHANAQYYCVMSALMTGASVIVTERFSATRWAAQARDHDATLASLFAAPIRMILSKPATDSDDRNRLRATFFAQNLTPTQIETFERRFGCPLLQLYGMTETVLPPLVNPLFGSRDNMTLGLPLPQAAIRVVDADGADVAIDEPGELLVGGQPGVDVMMGYLEDGITSTAALHDGWLHTGDSVYVRADGFVVFHDRLKDMIKRSGENIASAEVERVINEHPAVFECAVFGIPDDIRDEAIKACVVLREGATTSSAELQAHCGARLPAFKVPDYVEFVDALLRTPVGKIRKYQMRTPGVS